MKSIMLNLIFLSLSLPVMANTVKFEFSGYIDIINSNENNALGNVYLNQPFNGWFSYSSVADQYPSSATTGHYHQDASISVALGTQTLSYIDDYVYIRVYDNYQGEDTFSFGVDATQGDFNFTFFGVYLSDSTGMVFNNDDLPMSFNLAQFDSSRLVIAGYKLPNWDWFDIGGKITNMTLVPHLPTTYYVNAAEGSDNNDGLSPQAAFATIQKAIDSALDGDTVLVADGTYTGPGNRDIDFLGKAITVRSTDPNDPNIVAATIIDCNGTETDPHRGFRFHSGEDADSVLEGFTITNGYAPITAPHRVATGGAIDCINSSPTIRQCIIRSNLAGVGGGIYCGESESIISKCEITGNSARYGGGIRLHTCQSEINNCLITDNTAWEQMGGGMIVSFSDANIINCTFSNNTAHMFGGAIYYDESMVTITNCILWENSPTEISEGPRADGAVRYSDVQGSWPGEGNIDADPCFVEPGYWDANDTPDDVNDDFWVEGDYYLLPYSLCIDTGDPNYVAEPNETDIDGNPRVIGGRIDMGAYESNYIQAAMKLTPQMLNCNSKGKYVKAHLTLPEGFLPQDVDVNESAIAEPMSAESEYIKVLGAGPVRLEICFDREAFCDGLTETGEVEITVIGSLTTSRYFYATDTIKIKPRR